MDPRKESQYEEHLNGSNADSKRAPRPFSGGLDTVLVKGFASSRAASNDDKGVSALLTFLENKSKAKVMNHELITDDDLHIQVRPVDTAKFLGLNTFKFTGYSPLDITLLTKAADTGIKSDLKAALRTLLEQRYNEQSALLDLSSLGQDPLFAEQSESKRAEMIQESNFVGALAAVCSESFSSGVEKRDKVKNISLASNNITNLDGVKVLCQYFPLLQGLDLSNNKIRKVNALEPWRRKFKALSLLVVSNNPFTLDASDQTWQEELIKWFPALVTLNDFQVRSEEEAARNSALHSVDFKIAGPHISDESGAVAQFMYNLVAGFDNNRSQLAAAYYDNTSTFTLCDLIKDKTSPDPYVKKSRNLCKVATAPTRMDRLFTGTEAVQAVWASMPPTRHPDLDQEGDEWCVDSQMSPAVPSDHNPIGINSHIINAHGKFEELDAVGNRTGVIRSFDRTIVIVPGQGFQGFRVVSDQLTLRDPSSPDAWRPGQPATRLVPENPDPVVNNPAANDLTIRENLVQTMIQATNLTREYATMCFEHNNWDPEAAWANWLEVQPTLGPEAFNPVPPTQDETEL